MSTELSIVYAYDRVAELRRLFGDYTRLLVESQPGFDYYLELQKYDDEYLNPGEKYALPDGRLFLALWKGEPVGCIALRRFDAESCEMKRLYVRPEYRGRGIGETLVKKLIAEAGEMGYRRMLLDTLPVLAEAMRLYERLGFRQSPPHLESPVSETVFMSLEL